jgi:tetratricopeptide (TPR) repeat protein
MTAVRRFRHSSPGSRVLTFALSICCCLPARGSTREQAPGLRETYLACLQTLATQGIDAGTNELVELEAAVALQQGTGGLDNLRAVEIEVADDLARAGTDLLLPLIAMHEQAHLAYQHQVLEANPFHARTTLYAMAQLYAEGVTTAAQRETASDLFVSLAGYFQEGPGAGALYVRALQFNPANEAALLGLATAREQLGRYRNALQLLERLAETGSDRAEGHLRLAINLDRLGRRSEAEELLAGLIEKPGPDWVLIVAYQQLARIRMDQERLGSAHAYLVRGRKRFPDDPALTVGLFYVEERLALQPQEPLAAWAHSRDPAFRQTTARYRYARPPYEYLDEVRRQLREIALQSLRELAETLTRMPGGA